MGRGRPISINKANPEFAICGLRNARTRITGQPQSLFGDLATGIKIDHLL
jgi:hypothetical protein